MSLLSTEPSQSFSGALLSAMAIFLASLLNILLQGLRLKGGCCNVDPWVRAERVFTRPAPVGYWQVFMVRRDEDRRPGNLRATDISGNKLPVSLRVGSCFRKWPCFWITAGFHLLFLDVYAANDAPSPTGNDPGFAHSFQHLNEQDAHATQHLDQCTNRWLGDWGNPPQPLRPLQDPPWPDDFEEEPEVRIPARVLRFQQHEFYTEVSAAAGTDNELVIATISEQLLEGDTHHNVVEVFPQPDDSVITVLMVPIWWKHRQHVLVAIDPSELHRPLYMTVLARRGAVREICLAVSAVNPRSVDGLSIAVENNRYPMGEDDVAMPKEGCLIRVTHHRDLLQPLVGLDVAMGNLDWVHDVENFGLPTPLCADGRLLIILRNYGLLINATHSHLA